MRDNRLRALPFLVTFWLACLPTAAFSMTTGNIIEQSRTLAAEHKYTQALAILQDARKREPDNIDLTVAFVSVLSWEGKYAQAQSVLNQLPSSANDNADVLLVRADLASYQQQYPLAQKLYLKILSRYPHYQDARIGLQRVQENMKQPETQVYLWQIDTGYENSSFNRVNQANWSQTFLQVSAFSRDHTTSIHEKIVEYDEFSTKNTEYETGIDRIFSSTLSAYLYGSYTPNATFRPRYHVAAGGATHIANLTKHRIPLWLTLDTSDDFYVATRVININPGIRINLEHGWSFATRRIDVYQLATKPVYGEDYRLDGTIDTKTRGYIGYANAPDTENGITVMTRSYFYGIDRDLSPRTTLHISATNENRTASYLREVLDAGLSYRF